MPADCKNRISLDPSGRRLCRTPSKATYPHGPHGSDFLDLKAPLVHFFPSLAVGGGISVTAGSSIPVMAIAAVEAMFWVYCKIQHMTFVSQAYALTLAQRLVHCIKL